MVDNNYACLLTKESLFFEPPWEKKIGSNYWRVWLYLGVRTSQLTSQKSNIKY